MNSRPYPLLIALLGLLTLVLTSNVSAQEDFEGLKKRFKERFAVLLKLKNDGKVGETAKGYIEPLKEEFLKEEVKPQGRQKPLTLESFLEEENKDRKLLYKLLAEKLNQPVEEIALQNAIRNFKKAEPNHYLKLRNEQWVQKQKLDMGG